MSVGQVALGSTAGCGRAPGAFVAANDQPWSQPFRFWLDEACTQPLVLTAAGGWLQWPGGSSNVALEATAALNVATLSLAQSDLTDLRLGTWWGELQYEIDGDTVGSLRFDLLVAQGYGTGLSATKGVSGPLDVVVCATAPLDVVVLFAGSAAAPYLTISPAVLAALAALGVQALNVDDALLGLAGLAKSALPQGGIGLSNDLGQDGLADH